MFPNEIIMYLRKSRADGECETVMEVLAKHEIQLQAYALKTYGAEIPEGNIYREVVSGETIQDRPQMIDVLKRIENSSVKAVLVIEPQRLTRGDLEDCGRIIRSFRYTETLVITPMKTFDLSNEFDRDYFEMELMNGKKYLEYTKKILNRGRLASVNRGNYIGTYAPYGYDKAKIGKDCTLVPNSFAPIVKMIFNDYVNGGMSIVAISDKLNKMGIKPLQTNYFKAFTIRGILTNPVYIGMLRWNYKKTVKIMRDGVIVETNPTAKNGEYILVKGKHEAIIDKQLFDAAQKRIGSNPKLKKNRPLINILAGIFYCECGKAMNYRVYGNRARPRYHCTDQKFCKVPSATADDVLSTLYCLIEKDMAEFQEQIERAKESPNKLQDKIIESLENELQTLDKQQEKLYDLLENGTYTEEMFKTRNSKLSEKRNSLTAAIVQTKTSVQKSNNAECIIQLQTLLNTLYNKNITIKEQNKLLKTIINRVQYSRTNSDFTLIVEYNF